jgi:segregation and condensation protein B
MSGRSDGDFEQFPLGLDDFAEPDDQGLSLDELGQAYAALLNKGSDPYSQAGEQPPGAAQLAEPVATTLPLAVIPDAVIPDQDDECCEVTPRSILEAILFVGHPANEPLTSERIAALMRGVRPSEIDDMILELNAEYAAAGSPYVILSIDCGYQFALRPEYGSLRDAFYGRIREARLSQSAIDVLAIVAYQQPVGPDEIERLRGKPSGGILSQLVRRDLLSLERQSDRKAKPLFRTTERFLGLFELEDLADLPRSQEIEQEFYGTQR